MSDAPEPDDDLAYLGELLRDFGVPGAPDVEDALRLMADRFEALFDRCSKQGQRLRDATPEGWVSFVRFCHHQLYEGLLVNAGEFRRAEDPEHNVFFGGYNPRTMQERHKGRPPAQIEAALLAAFAHLNAPSDPVAAIARAYERMQDTHPFYDANGRIGRLVVTLFLAGHGLRFNWAALDAPPTPPRTRPFKEDLYKALSYAQRQGGRHIGKLMTVFQKHIEPFEPPA